MEARVPESEVVAGKLKMNEQLPGVTNEDATAPPPSIQKTDSDDDTPSAALTDEHEEDDDDVSACFAEIGFMFEGSQATTVDTYSWSVDNGRTLQVSLERNDSEPGAVISGHYLWPAAKLLADYLVQEKNVHREVSCIVELGAGCGLVSMVALQLWQSSLQCLVVTDHDPGTLGRSRSNYESTLDAAMNASVTEDELNATINNLASIPVCFEDLEWGDAAGATAVGSILAEHTTRESERACLMLGSDLIYSHAVVEPLLKTVAMLLSKDSTAATFLLSQSFGYDSDTEAAIDTVCERLDLKRTILLDEEESKQRIQRFRWNPS